MEHCGSGSRLMMAHLRWFTDRPMESVMESVDLSDEASQSLVSLVTQLLVQMALHTQKLLENF